MRRLKRSLRYGHGFTLIELLVVIAIIAILAAILFPVFARARESARGISCVSNMKQIGTAIQMYVQDYDGSFPATYWDTTKNWGCAPWGGWMNADGGWAFLVNPYVKNGGIYVCPSAEKPFWLAGSTKSNGWCSKPDSPEYADGLAKAAPLGVSYLYKKATAGAPSPYLAGHPINDAEYTRPSSNVIVFEYAAWHFDRNTTVYRYNIDVNKLFLNAVYTDGHAKLTKANEWRHNRYNLGYGMPPKATDLDWFLTDDNYAACPHCNSATPDNGDCHDID